jgi:hypothetical protein
MLHHAIDTFMNADNEKPWYLRVLPDFLAFTIGLGLAWHLKWETKDLVWSLWLCSLVLGYLTLLSALAGGAWFGLSMLRHSDFKPKHRKVAILAGTGFGLFFLAFFSLHFCGFHAGHSVFLNLFFPIEGMPRDGFGAAFMNPPLLWALTFSHLMLPYGIFLLPALIAERKYVFKLLFRAATAVREGTEASEFMQSAAAKKSGKKNNPIGEAMGRPYLNVMRMHLLIFFFAGAHFLKIDSFLIYAVVYSVYFFPWAELKRLRAGNRTAPVDADKCPVA